MREVRLSSTGMSHPRIDDRRQLEVQNADLNRHGS